MIADRDIEESRFLTFVMKAHDFFEPQLEKCHCKSIIEYAQKLMSKGTIAYLEMNNEIIGAVIGYTHDTPDNTSYITQVLVLPDYRGKGIVGSLLIEYLNFCRKSRLDKVWLTTQKDNLSAQRAYEKAGFVIDKHYCDKNLVKYIYPL